MLSIFKQLEVYKVKKTVYKKLTLIISIVLIAMFLLAACESTTRLPTTYTFNPGPAFSTNFNHDDPRRQVRCAIIFEVIDEDASTELNDYSYIIRNAVLTILGELTMDEITTQRDLSEIAQRIVERVNEDLGSTYDLITRAYFTEFAIT